MDSEGNLSDATVTKNLKSQTDISTGIGPTGTDTPAPKDIMPHTDDLEHSLEEPLSRPPGALFQAGSGLKNEMSDKIPEPISELSNSLSLNVSNNIMVKNMNKLLCTEDPSGEDEQILIS